MSLSEAARPLRRPFIWTQEGNDLVRTLVGKGAIGSELVAATGAPDLDCVYRKVEQLGLRLNRSRSAERRIRKQAFGGPQCVPIGPGAQDYPPEPSDAAMMLLDEQLDDTRCRWPISGAALDTMFCGERAAGTYCDRHHRIAYRGKRLG